MELIEHRAFQIIFRVIGIALLPIILILSFYGAIFLYSAMVKPSLISLTLGLATPFGLLGYFAAFYRVSKKWSSMSTSQVKYIRLGLTFGVISSLMLLALVVYFDLGFFAALLLLGLCFGGIYLVRATPANT